MKGIRWFAGLLACLMLFGLTGCTQKNNTAGKMHYDLTAEPINLDPQTASDLSSLTVINQMFEGLVTVDENGEILCAAASSYQVSEDGLTYEFMLRSDLQWQNGNLLDAEDYAFGLQRVLMAETCSPYAASYFGIVGAEAYHAGEIDFFQVGIYHNGLRLVITLNQPDETFLNRMASTAAMPCDKAFFESTKGKYGLEADTILANGPFYLQTWAHDQYLKLTKNDNYRDAADVKIAGVTMWTNNVEGREETFWKGNTQACYVTGESYAQNHTDAHTADAIANTVYGVVFHKNSEVLQNTQIRKAITALFSRENYADKLPDYLTVTDRAYASDCAVNAKPYYLEKDTIDTKATIEQAKEWFAEGLEQLGITGISGLKIVVPADEQVPVGDYFLELSQAYQRYFDLYIGIERLEKEAFDAAIASGEYDLAIVPIVSEDLSPISMLADFSNGYFACTDPEFTQLYRNLTESVAEDVMQNLQHAEEILLTDGWFIPMYEQSQFFVCGSNTQGIRYNPYTGLVSFRYAEFLTE